MLREGGNAVDAAVAAVLASFAAESPLTGFGAGGFMLVQPRRGDRADRLLRRGARQGRGRAGRGAGPGRRPLRRGRRAGLQRRRRVMRGSRGPRRGWRLRWSASARCRSPSWWQPGVRLAREGAPVTASRPLLESSAHPHAPHRTREVYAPEGRLLREGETFRFPELAEALERFAAEGAEPFYRGEIAAAPSDSVVAQAGPSAAADLAATSRSSGSPSGPPSAGPRC